MLMDDQFGIALTSGAYSSKSVIANAQRCVNLYPEANPQATRPPVPVTHYQRPGKVLLSSPAVAGYGRCLYRGSNGVLYTVINDTVYYIDAAFVFHPIGNIDAGNTPVSMADNGVHAGNSIILVDGTTKGYIINMTTQAFSQLVDGTGLFVGADVVLFLQTFFLFNMPGTQNWYVSLADSTTFNALDIAAKASYADNIATMGIRQREVWLIGEVTTEPWYLAGGADFQFEAMPSIYVPYGCMAKYSLAFTDINLFWLARNLTGQKLVVKSEGYEAKRISNFAIEKAIQGYGDVSDAIGTTYQLEGHTFYVVHFPRANHTWVYDLATDQWHELTWTDPNGAEHRDRVVFYILAYDTVLGVDWQNGDLYRIDPTVYQDDGDPIVFRRGFPHVLDKMNRVTHWSFTADMECGTIEDQEADPQLNLRWSDDRGKTWEDPMQVSLGRTGEYDTSPQFQQLGMARDRVYELFWSENMKTALNGAYVDPEGSES